MLLIIMIINICIMIILVIIMLMKFPASGQPLRLRRVHRLQRRGVRAGARKGTNRVGTNGGTSIFMCFDRGTFWVLPLTYIDLVKSARAYLFPNLLKIITFAAAPTVFTPLVRNQGAFRHDGGHRRHPLRVRWALRERSKWVKSEQQLPGTSQTKAKESQAGYFWRSRNFGKFRFSPPPK